MINSNSTIDLKPTAPEDCSGLSGNITDEQSGIPVKSKESFAVPLDLLPQNFGSTYFSNQIKT